MSTLTPARKRAMLIAANDGKIYPSRRHAPDDNRNATWTILQRLRDLGWMRFVQDPSWTCPAYYELTEKGHAVLRENGYVTTPATAINPDSDAATRPLPSHGKVDFDAVDAKHRAGLAEAKRFVGRAWTPQDPPLRITTREQWVDFAAWIGYFAHEASERGFHARVEGRTLDDHGVWPRPDLHGTDAETIRELHVVIERHMPTPENENRWVDVAVINLAQLLQWGGRP